MEMKYPETGSSQSENKNRQRLVLLLLILVFICLMAGYIYYGMYQARGPQSDNSIPTENTSNGLSEEQKQQILQQLSETSGPSLPEEEKEAILEDLEAAPTADTMNPEERQAILEALNQR